MKPSIVVGAPMAMLIFDKFMSAPDTAIEPSKRGSVVLSASLSIALPFRRNQPAVPAAMPLKDQTPDLLTAPPVAAAKVKPLVGEPATKAPELSVTVPSSVPVAAASAVAGCVPVRTSMMPLAKVAAKPVEPARLFLSPVDKRTVMAVSP